MGYGYGSYSDGGYGYYGYGGYGYTPAAPYGHGAQTYGPFSAPTASSFTAYLSPGQSESFSRQVGARSSSVYAVRDLDGTTYGRYATYNSATGLSHVDTVYGHPGPYSGYVSTTYYALQPDGYAFAEQTTSYSYHPGGGEPSYLVDHETRQYSYTDGSSLDISDYFRSDATPTATGTAEIIYQSEAQTATDAYGYSTYGFTSSTRMLSF